MIKYYPLNPTIGTLLETHIVGRDLIITQLLRLLQSQSISLEEMRRMGKTMILQKLAYLCNNDNLPSEFKKGRFRAKYFSFQGKQNLGEVIDELIRELESMKAWYKIDFSRTYDLLRKIINSPTVSYGDATFTVNLPEFKKSWKEIFFKVLEDIAQYQLENDSLLILIFDELPIMLWEWHMEEKHDEALELLDILRQKRQHLERKGIRFIYCGSIGIKVVLNTFRTKYGYTGEATNDMEEVSVGPFSFDETCFLCECYTLSGFNIIQAEKDNLWQLTHKLTNGLPYYTSKVFNILQTEFDKNITTENIHSAYQDIINNSNHHKAFNQLIQRINIYYPKDKSDAMIKILTIIAKNDNFLSEKEIMKISNLEEVEVSQNLYDLYADHYLTREIKDGERLFQFKYEIFKQWWKINIA